MRLLDGAAPLPMRFFMMVHHEGTKGMKNKLFFSYLSKKYRTPLILTWEQVRRALDDIHFTGWASAEVGGGYVERLTKVRKQMQKAFGI